jgi:hypothetical protein
VSGRIERIKKAMESKEGCGSKHLRSIPIMEQFDGKTIWEGIVEMFELDNHPTANRAYAWERWRDEQKSDAEYTVVLAVPPVNSAQDAVKAAIITFQKQRGE